MRRRVVRELIVSLAAARQLPHRCRPALLRSAGVTVGERCLIKGGLEIAGYSTVAFGSGVFVNVGCFIDAQGDVVIGNGVSLGDHVRIITSTHELGPAIKRAGRSVARTVQIGEGCWLGSSSVVLPGVTMSPGSVLAAGAVLTSSTERSGVYAGVPAKLVRELD